MMPAHRFHRPSRILAACAVLALAGCASNKVLDNQLANTQEAIDQARIAGAADAAPADLSAAVDKLEQARSTASHRRGKDSMRLAEEAQVDANLARAKTDSAQARIAAAEITKSNQVLYDELNRMRQNQSR
jgi:hypothetical protein